MLLFEVVDFSITACTEFLSTMLRKIYYLAPTFDKQNHGQQLFVPVFPGQEQKAFQWPWVKVQNRKNKSRRPLAVGMICRRYCQMLLFLFL